MEKFKALPINVWWIGVPIDKPNYIFLRQLECCEVQHTLQETSINLLELSYRGHIIWMVEGFEWSRR